MYSRRGPQESTHIFFIVVISPVQLTVQFGYFTKDEDTTIHFFNEWIRLVSEIPGMTKLGESIWGMYGVMMRQITRLFAENNQFEKTEFWLNYFTNDINGFGELSVLSIYYVETLELCVPIYVSNGRIQEIATLVEATYNIDSVHPNFYDRLAQLLEILFNVMLPTESQKALGILNKLRQLGLTDQASQTVLSILTEVSFKYTQTLVSRGDTGEIWPIVYHVQNLFDVHKLKDNSLVNFLFIRAVVIQAMATQSLSFTEIENYFEQTISFDIQKQIEKQELGLLLSQAFAFLASHIFEIAVKMNQPVEVVNEYYKKVQFIYANQPTTENAELLAYSGIFMLTYFSDYDPSKLWSTYQSISGLKDVHLLSDKLYLYLAQALVIALASADNKYLENAVFEYKCLRNRLTNLTWAERIHVEGSLLFFLLLDGDKFLDDQDRKTYKAELDTMLEVFDNSAFWLPFALTLQKSIQQEPKSCNIFTFELFEKLKYKFINSNEWKKYPVLF